MTENKKVEYVDVTIKLPKEVVAYLRAHVGDLSFENMEEYIEDTIIQSFRADLDSNVFSNEIIKFVDSFISSTI